MNTTLPDPDGDLLAAETAQPTTPADGLDSERPGGRFTKWLHRPDDGIVGGVAVDLADRLGLDVLWVRLAFVVLLLLGGLGAVVYGGMWLAFVVGADHRGARIAGGIVLLAGVPLLIANADLGLATGTGAVIILLIGLTLALWNRGREPVAQVRHDVSRPDGLDGPDRSWLSELPASGRPPPQPHRTRRVRTRSTRPPSVLGRAALGSAIVVAAAGALIDEVNGGRLHPEQWLGAAAVVCGLGLLIGALRGHALWLVIPAVAFAAVGYVAGESAGIGLALNDVGSGDQYHYIGDFGGAGDASSSSLFGSSMIDVTVVPAELVRVDALSVFGNVNVSATNEATIELIARADGGGVDINGSRVPNGTHRVGPPGDPDVIIDARTLHGEIMLFTYDAGDQEVPVSDGFDPSVSTVPSFGEVYTIVGQGVTMTSDGTTIILDGQAVIDPNDQPLLGDWYAEDESRVEWPSEVGTWQLVNGLLITPFGEVLDLSDIRSEVVGPQDFEPEG